MDFYRIKPVSELEMPDYEINGTFSTSLEDITDVSISTPLDGQALVYDSSLNLWKPGTVATTSSSTSVSLEDVNDVSISSTPQTGDSLIYDASLQLWQPSNSNRRNYQYKQFTDRLNMTLTGQFNWQDIVGFNTNPLSITTLQANSKNSSKFKIYW